MALKGDLASVDLGQVFQMLALNQKTGILSIYSDEAWKALYFDRRGVTLHYNPYTFPDRVLEYLVRMETLTEDQVARAKEFLKRRGGDITEALQETEAMDPEEFDRIFSMQMEEDVYDLFFWKDARFEFFENKRDVPGKEGLVDERFFFNPDSMIMEAARRMDEWSVIRERIPNAQEILAPTADMSQVNVLDLEDSTLSVFDLVDGKRNIDRIVEITGFTQFGVFKALLSLLDQGYVEILGPAELASHAVECLAEGRTADGINLLQRAAAAGVGGYEVHLTVAKAYESIEELEQAIFHYKTYAEGLTAEDHLAEAVDILREVIALVPTDLRARERLVSLATTSGEVVSKKDFDPVAEGRKLIDLYVEMGELERARSVVESLLEISPNDLDLIKSLVTIHSKAGDNKRVLELYDIIAGELVRQKDLMGAIKYLQKILLIDKERKDVSERIRQLYLQEERSRSRRRGFTTMVVVIVCVVALGALYSWYELNARKSYECIDPAVWLEKGDYAGAAQLYQDFLDKYPLSLIRSSAQSDLDDIVEKETLNKAKTIAAEAKAKKVLDGKRKTYLALYMRFQDLAQKENDWAGALKVLEEVAAGVHDCGEREDLSWAKQYNIEQNLADFKAYLVKAKALKQTMDNALVAGQYRVAYLQSLNLLEKYPMSPEGKNLQVPIRLISKPAGATVWAGEKALVDSKTGQPITTPCTLTVRPASLVRVSLRKKGYRNKPIRLTHKSSSPLKVNLPVEPAESYSVSGLPTCGSTGAANYLVAGISGGTLVALDRRTGKEAWRSSLPGLSEVTSGPVADGSMVFFGTSGKSVRAVDLVTGKEIWADTVSGTIKADPLVLKEGVVFVTLDGWVKLYEKANGQTLWRTKLTGAISATPVSKGTLIYVPLETGRIVALDVESGANCIDLAAGGGKDSHGALHTPLLLTGDYLLAATNKGYVDCYNLQKGTMPWTFDQMVTFRRTVLVDAGSGGVVVGREDGFLFRLDLETGKSSLEIDLKTRVVAGPLIRNGYLYIAVAGKKGKDRLLCLDPDTLMTEWSFEFAGRILPPMRVIPGRLLISCSDKKVYGFP